ncbi:MAG TPA: FAD-dependent oxidoreductase [Bdellovibrionota bacterium]|nr:FAD-dependent oxidoreductase [Bdellovibrionota bacterium]
MSQEHIAVVIGGAVAGSEATLKLREKGIRVILIEQNPLPYGKIEDGLPRWHVEQRKKEEEKINERLDHALVHFVPSTKLGKDLSFEEIYKEWSVSAILLASGAWRDRPVGVEEFDRYVGKGLLYQNPVVYWFNHYHEPSYNGPRYEIPDNTIVVGGGLASMDVLKICQFEITQRALLKRGIKMDMLTLEKEGIPRALEKHGLKWADLGLKGTTLYYRRRVQDMPLADTPPKPTPEQLEKADALRTKIFNNYQSKNLFNMQERHLPKAPIIDNGSLVGIRFTRTEIVDRKVRELPNTEVEVRFNLAISSIGSIPESIPGIPQKGETYEVEDLETGKVKNLPNVYALGNAVTGKGNIRVSMMHGRKVAEQVATMLAAQTPKTTNAEKLMARVKALQSRAGYDGNFKSWVEKQLAMR